MLKFQIIAYFVLSVILSASAGLNSAIATLGLSFAVTLHATDEVISLDGLVATVNASISPVTAKYVTEAGV